MIRWEQILVGLLLSGLAVIALNLPYWSKRKPRMTCHAFIKSKRVRTQKGYLGSRYNYVITFVIDERKEVDLCVIEPIYGTLKEGVSGTLTYQGESLLEFQEDSLREY